MSSGSTSGGPRPYRRGLISCLHSLTCRADSAHLPTDQDLPEAIYNLIVGYYEQAFDRLPCEIMPELLRLLRTAGFCLGLLDPVSNIILNTIALLPDDDDDFAASPPAAKRSKRLSRAALPGSGRGGCPWLQVAIRSYYGLLDFLLTYFGCLTMEQAIRYLYWARADLLLAVKLVQHDLYQDGMDLEPASERTQAALKWAANRAGHPSPNTLAQIMTIRLHGVAFDLVKWVVAYGGALNPDVVQHLHCSLRSMTRPPCDAQVNHVGQDVVVRVSWNLQRVAETTDIVDVSSQDGSTTTTTTTTIRWLGQPIISVRDGLSHMISECLEQLYCEKDTLKSQCGDNCDYLQSLKMCAHSMIHGFYMEVFKLLPTPSGSLMRIILIAGHCYGSMDPVSNIIVNTILYKKHDLHVTEPDHERIEPYTDILDPLSLLRLVVCSLKGLTELAVLIEPFASVCCALETLCSAKCNIANTFPGSRNNPFHETAMAAGYPLPSELAELHKQLLLYPVQRSKLLSLITEAQTKCTALPIDKISYLLHNMSSLSTRILFQAPELNVDALSMVLKKISQYEARRGVLRTKIEQLLEKYTSEHYWEPTYTLNFICGVEEIGQGPSCYDNNRYHVNFMASSELQKTLFFAEFWLSHEPKPSFCCPVPYPDAGRCYYGVDSARKLAYPDREEYILCDITEHGTRNVHEILETDIVYFSSKIDTEVAEKLNLYCAREPRSLLNLYCAREPRRLQKS